MKENAKVGLYVLLLFILGIIMTISLASCQKEGYGCKGNSKIMTRVR